jgi:peptidoglycan hydrolase-like protein with peptidoglycan-binding domain
VGVVDEWLQNTRGLIIIVLAVATCALLLAVDPGNGFPNGVGTTSGGSTATTITPTPSTTTKPGSGSSTTTTTVARPTLQQGSSGADVTDLQTQLAKLGYDVGTPDGNFGATTQAAVIAFQTKEGISPADGVVNAATWAALAKNQ